MAAILQITGWQRHAALVYCVLLWYWTSMLWSTDICQKRYPLTSITWPYRGVKLTAHRGHVFFEVDRWPSAGFSIGSRVHVWLTCWKQYRIVWKPVNANPGLKVNWIITFSSIQMFLLLFCVYGDYWNSKQKAKQYTENLSAKLQFLTQIKILLFPWVRLIGLWTTQSRSYTFRLA